jgi:short-subunit dehydrogenase
VITGASSGLGEALAHKFAECSAQLTLSARRYDRLQLLRDTISKRNPKIDILIEAADMASKESCRALINSSVTHFGGLDVFVANAGQGMWSRFRDLSDPDRLNELMQINYMGVVYGLFFSLPYLRKHRGSFVAVSSIQGVIPVAFHTGYVASKHAVNGLINAIRLEEPDVHFLLALPSWISGTELRTHALSGIGEQAIQVKKTPKKGATSTKDCAGHIVSALMSKKKQIFIPKKYQCVPVLRDIFTSTFDRIVMSQVKGQLKD